MEQLVARWKQNSSNTSLSRYSDKKLVNSQAASNQKSKTGRRELSSESSSSSSDSFKIKKPLSQSQRSPQQNRSNHILKPPSSQKKPDTSRKLDMNDLSSSTRTKPNDASNFNQALDSTTFNIFQIFKHQLPQNQIIDQVKMILIDFAEQSNHFFGQGKQLQELQTKVLQQDKQMNIMKTAQSSMRDEMSRKLINELQDKLVESEQMKFQLQQQKDTLGKRFNELLQEVQKMQLKQEQTDRIQKENDSLQRNNNALIQQINIITEKDQQQQIIWNDQMGDLINMMDILKNQLLQQ